MSRFRLHLLVLLAFACAHAACAQERSIELRPVFGGAPLTLGAYKFAVGTGDTVSVDRFRFYLSAIELVFEDGSSYREPDSYHLVDAEDAATLTIRLAKVPAGKIAALHFNIGVDSAASVAGALSGDLDPVKGMYWAWNSGYINAKLEGSTKARLGQKARAYEFHIGGYLQPHYALRQVTLHYPKPVSTGKLTLQCDAAAWLQGVDFKKENSVVIPGEEAMRVADRYAKMFSLL
jgi:hypothetical protein